MMNKKVKIKLRDWDYTCGDGCCFMYGTAISVNGKESENEYDGGSVTQSLEFVLKELGHEDVDIEEGYTEYLTKEKMYTLEEVKKAVDNWGMMPVPKESIKKFLGDE